MLLNLTFHRYVARPYLINETKFDLRLYVLVTSMNPLRIYLYDDGLVRFASNKYTNESSKVHDVFTHLTNYSINKKSSTYLSNEEAEEAQVSYIISLKFSMLILVSSGSQVDIKDPLETF